ncbi:MAG: hypothetical protein Q9210_003441 [Variospora velana]
MGAIDQVWELYRAFKAHSTRFRVELISVRPLVGDLKIIENETKSASYVELKSALCTIEPPKGLKSGVLKHAQLYRGERPIFTSLKQWDYIFTEVVGRPQAFMLPRREIPLDWWDSTDISVGTTESFGSYAIDRSSDERTVQDIERVLTLENAKRGSAEDELRFPQDPIGASAAELLLREDIVAEATNHMLA